MAYNYKENEDYQVGADSILMNEEDYTSLQGYKDVWNAANAAGDQAGMSAAHDAAEALRAKYGYSGGANGSEYVKTPETQQFTYESAPSYTSKYQDQIDELTAQILNREAFSYDPATDPQYAAYKKEYTREGQRAAADVMGQYAAMTGGMPSSAAITAGQQAGDYYAAQMADKIPELYQLAYSMYQAEGDRQRADLEMLMALENGDFAKYQSLLSQYNTDRSFAYGQYADKQAFDYQAGRDQIADERYDAEWNYQVGRDQIADQRYEDETAYNRSVYESETQYNQALQKAQTLAAAGDFSGYKALGYSDAEIANLKTAYDAAQLLASKSSSNSSSSSSNGNSDTHSANYEQVRKNAMAYDDPDDAISYIDRMVNAGYITEQEAADIYMVDLGGDYSVSSAVPTTWDEYYAATGTYPSLTQSEFNRLGSAARYGSYKEQLAAEYSKWLSSNK